MTAIFVRELASPLNIVFDALELPNGNGPILGESLTILLACGVGACI